ncbi:MAG: hypothetical protein KZQ85_10880 [Candidatus Thiodiazotropha sp. (ex Myrtea sp. 'scaly one' KF741663)]|nr:hypothetical protein [Candidatus Thiodiazotropha sp. (ex Myrtea sp. 'scaly one' KF741663)]
MKKLVSILFFALAASHCYGSNDQVPIDRHIQIIKTYQNFATIYFSPDFVNTQGCSSTNQGAVILDLSTGETKEMYSAAIAAATANKMVGFGISGCELGALGYPMIYRIDVNY